MGLLLQELFNVPPQPERVLHANWRGSLRDDVNAQLNEVLSLEWGFPPTGVVEHTTECPYVDLNGGWISIPLSRRACFGLIREPGRVGFLLYFPVLEITLD
jgi:hypothetical protein